MNMILQLKDLASQKLISVPEEGLTFGREGGDAQVQVADMGVSKRHAEIFCEGGAWFLKDLGSSNGTLLANERINDPTEILPGDVFQLSKRKFEVLKVIEDGADDEAPPEDDGPQLTEPERKPVSRPGGKPAAAAAKSAPPPAKKPAGQKLAPAGKTSEPTRGAPDDEGADEALGDAGVAQVLAGVPRAVAYYLVNVPLMLLNPFGTIRKGIEEQPKDPMGRFELIAWALPGNLFSGAVGFIAGLIAQLITGGLSVASLLGGLAVGAIVAVVASVVTGFIWHPLLTWVISKLFKGESDARGRTNYFLQTQTAVIIAVLPSGLTIVVDALRARLGIPFIGLVPVVLSAIAGALALFIFIKWMEHFGTAKWVKIVGYVLLALTAVSALAGIPRAISGGGAPVVAMGSGGDVEVPQDLEEAWKLRLEQLKAAGMSEEQIKAQEDLFKKAQEATKNANAMAAEAQQAAAEAARQGAEAVKAAADEAKKAVEEPKNKKAPPPADPPKEDVKPVEKPAVAAESEPVKAPPPPAPVPSGSGYPAWRAKYDNIEKRVTEDPTVLKGRVLQAYLELQEKTAEADAAARKEHKKADPKTLSHLRNAELYERSQGTVNELHKLLFAR